MERTGCVKERYRYAGSAAAESKNAAAALGALRLGEPSLVRPRGALAADRLVGGGRL
jgi:hypothetical protein